MNAGNPSAPSETINAEGPKPHSLLVLKSKSESLKQAEHYLTNKEWSVNSCLNLREAIINIIKKQPEFIMITVDHSNKKVKILPQVLAQAFPVRVIMFAENQSATSVKSLKDMQFQYSLFAPVSGLAVERMVMKILRDDEIKSQEFEERKRASEQVGSTINETIHLKGQKASTADLAASLEQARAALRALANDGDVAIDATGKVTTEKTSKTSKPESRGPAYSGSALGSSTAKAADAAYMGGAGKTSSAKSEIQTSNAAGLGSTSSEQSARAAMQTGPIFAPGHHAKTQTAKSGTVGTTDQPKMAQHESSLMGEWEGMVATGPPKGKKPKLTPQYKHGTALSQGPDSIIVKATQQALDESVVVRDDLESYQEVSVASNCLCIIIESNRFKGYLVAALGKDRKFDDVFRSLIQKKLLAFLLASGEPVKNSDSMDVKLQEVEFEDWAVEHAEFLRKSIHNGDEIAMAFFPATETTIPLEATANDNMVMMKIDELKEEVVVEFDLYIFMPENQKYLLYTPQGRPLIKGQKRRLADKGVTHLHLKKESAKDVKKYRAQNFLNEKIEAYKQKLKNRR